MIVVSMFDESGVMVRPWSEAGCECYCFDIVNENRTEGNIHYIKADLSPGSQALQRIIALNPDIIFGFGPCTDLAVSGARHFEAKRARNPAFQDEAIALWATTETVANDVGCPWIAENPVSVLSTQYRKPDFKFDPADYGGYLPEDHNHALYPDIFPPRDAYPKKTCIWAGNGFIMPEKRRVPAVKDFPGFKKLGGKSARTKQIRSTTPEGWAKAVFLANYKA